MSQQHVCVPDAAGRCAAVGFCPGCGIVTGPALRAPSGITRGEAPQSVWTVARPESIPVILTDTTTRRA